MVKWKSALRRGEWLELEFEDETQPPEARINAELSQEPLPPVAGSHPHELRQWLLAYSSFPSKWINRLFSVGGIRWQGGRIQLQAFPQADVTRDPLYVKAIKAARDSGEANRAKASNAAMDAGGAFIADSGAGAAKIAKTDKAERPYVLYEDDYCLVMYKPAGMPVHASFEGQTGTLDEAAASHLVRQEDPLPVRHIHRLDDDTSGPVLYSKNDLAQLKLDEAMRNKAIDRNYIAVVHGAMQRREGIINHPIGKDRHHGGRRRVTPSGDSATTHYRRLAAGRDLSLVSLRLETGRTHQIRVHMSFIGHPLVGDSLYGGSKKLLGHQALHGERLRFPHPLTDCHVEISAPWPGWLGALSKHIGPS